MIKSNDTLTFNYVGKETYFYTCMWVFKQVYV